MCHHPVLRSWRPRCGRTASSVLVCTAPSLAAVGQALGVPTRRFHPLVLFGTMLHLFSTTSMGIHGYGRPAPCRKVRIADDYRGPAVCKCCCRYHTTSRTCQRSCRTSCWPRRPRILRFCTGDPVPGRRRGCGGPQLIAIMGMGTVFFVGARCGFGRAWPRRVEGEVASTYPVGSRTSPWRWAVRCSASTWRFWAPVPMSARCEVFQKMRQDDGLWGYTGAGWATAGAGSRGSGTAGRANVDCRWRVCDRRRDRRGISIDDVFRPLGRSGNNHSSLPATLAARADGWDPCQYRPVGFRETSGSIRRGRGHRMASRSSSRGVFPSVDAPSMDLINTDYVWAFPCPGDPRGGYRRVRLYHQSAVTSAMSSLLGRRGFSQFESEF